MFFFIIYTTIDDDDVNEYNNLEFIGGNNDLF